MPCLSCFKDYLGKCTDTITLYIGLSDVAYPSFTWTITDKFEKKYTGALTQADTNEWTIDVADLPDGFFNPYAGVFKLEIMDDGCIPIPFNVYVEKLDETRAFDCIEFHVRGGSIQKQNLGCQF